MDVSFNHQLWLMRKYFSLWHSYVVLHTKKYKPFQSLSFSTWGRMVEIYDGDTIKILLKFRGCIDQWTIRLHGYDSPELKPSKELISRDEEIICAKRSKQALYDLLNNKIVFVKVRGMDKYGRFLGDIYYNHIHINQWMIDNGFGIKYDGGKKVK